MSARYPTSPIIMSSTAACALRDYPLYNMFVVLQRDLKDVSLDELEKRIMDY